MDDLISRQEAMGAFLADLTNRERKNNLHTWSTVEVKYYISETLEQLRPVDAIPVVRCANCTVQHNRWTGCPKLGGLIPPNDFYCGFGREDDADNG